MITNYENHKTVEKRSITGLVTDGVKTIERQVYFLGVRIYKKSFSSTIDCDEECIKPVKTGFKKE